MALKSAQMADLNVPQATLDGAHRWLDHVAGKGKDLGRFGYTSSNDLKNAMTAEGLLCLEYLGTRREDSVLPSRSDPTIPPAGALGRQNTYHRGNAAEHGDHDLPFVIALHEQRR